MSAEQLPLLLEPELLENQLQRDNLLIVDLGKTDIYQQLHIPGAVHLDYAQIIADNKPVMGLLPEPERLNQLFSTLGITPETHVVAYDDEGGGKAARLLWTLAAMGHQQFSLLNGGIHAWAGEHHPVDNQLPTIAPSHFNGQLDQSVIAERDDILTKLDDAQTVLLDCRSIEEYQGIKRFAEKAGHIPGAVNLDWLLCMDQSHNLRMRPTEQLHDLLNECGVTPDKEVIVYCHTHHRSSFSYLMLKTLGYERVRGYPGSWSDWGNHDDTPVER